MGKYVCCTLYTYYHEKYIGETCNRHRRDLNWDITFNSLVSKTGNDFYFENITEKILGKEY